MSSAEGLESRLSRVDENVKIILKEMESIEQLKRDAVQNRLEHRILMVAVGLLSTPVLLWAGKILGISIG